MIERVGVSGLQSPDMSRANLVRAAGCLIMFSSAACALLPAGNFENGPEIVGSLMIFVGLIEMAANAMRRRGQWAIAAGLASLASGGLIVGQPVTTFVSTVYVVIAWLLVRGVLLTLSAIATQMRTRPATAFLAVLDIFLAGVVWTGFTASKLVIALFGPTTQIIADFAWVMAISFAGAGLLLVRVASEEWTP